MKLPMTFFTEVEQIILKRIWKHKRPQTVETILRKNRARRIMLHDFRLFYRSTVIKTVWYRYKTDT